MNFRPISDLLDLVLPHCPGYNDNSIIDQLRTAAIDLCRETYISQETQETAFAAGDHVVSISAPSAQVRPVFVSWVQTPRGALNPATIGTLDISMPNWRTELSLPTHYTVENLGELAIAPGAKSAEAPVYLRVAYVPTRTAASIDEQLVKDYGSILAAGALSRILCIGGQPWTDRVEADRQLKQFEIGVSRTRGEANVNRSGANPPRLIRPFR